MPKLLRVGSLCSLLLVAVIIFAPKANAMDLTSVQSEIQLITSQINSLQAAVASAKGAGLFSSPTKPVPAVDRSTYLTPSGSATTLTTPTATPVTTKTASTRTTISVKACKAPTITQNLVSGSKGAQVSALQAFLALNPTIYPQGQVTGFYGASTVSAVKSWQARNHITIVGSFGPVSRNLLASAGCATLNAGGATTIGTRAAPTSGSGTRSPAFLMGISGSSTGSGGSGGTGGLTGTGGSGSGDYFGGGGSTGIDVGGVGGVTGGSSGSGEGSDSSGTGIGDYFGSYGDLGGGTGGSGGGGDITDYFNVQTESD